MNQTVFVCLAHYTYSRSNLVLNDRHHLNNYKELVASLIRNGLVNVVHLIFAHIDGPLIFKMFFLFDFSNSLFKLFSVNHRLYEDAG